MQKADGEMEIQRTVQQVLRQASLSCTPEQLGLVVRYVQLLRRWNQTVNLVGNCGLEELVRQHFLESFLGAELIREGEGPVLDLGSGAGFPGMAMSLMRPEETFYLVESRLKKGAFLSAVKRELHRNKVAVINRSLRQCQPGDFPVPPGLLTMRAVADPERWALLARPLFREPMRLLFYTTEARLRPIREALPGVDWEPERPIPGSREKMLLKGSFNQNIL